MINKPISNFYTKIFFVTAVTSFILGCASMQTPQGGPKDTDPPKVLKMVPENLSTNFKANKIVIEFDEYVKLTNEFKEFSISPELDKNPELKIKSKKLEISIPDTLERNTTYTLNFGKSIVDLNESNELKNFTYVFATGPTLDSLSIKGNVTNAVTREPEIEALVFILPKAKDTLFGKKRAAIYTLTDSAGNFKLSNLKKDTYKLYALREKDGDKVYQQHTDEIAFLSENIVLTENVDSLKLRIFKEKAANFKVNDRRLNADGSIFMSFNQSLKNPKIELLNQSLNKEKFVKFSKNKDSVTLWLTDLSFDSTKVVISDNTKILDTVNFSRNKRDTYERALNFSDNLDGGTLNPFRDFSLTANFPIKNFNADQVLLLEDSIPRKFELIKDSLDFTKYYIKYKWRTKENYILHLKEGATTAIFDVKNKEIIRKFKLGDVNDYGTLALTVETPDTTKRYIVQIVDAKNSLLAAYPIAKNTVVKLSNYKQGIYYARIVYDVNKNEIWDTGDLKNGVQPEEIWYETKELSIRANWDREEILKIPLVAPAPIIKAKATTQKQNTNDRLVSDNKIIQPRSTVPQNNGGTNKLKK